MVLRPIGDIVGEEDAPALLTESPRMGDFCLRKTDVYPCRCATSAALHARDARAAGRLQVCAFLARQQRGPQLDAPAARRTSAPHRCPYHVVKLPKSIPWRQDDLIDSPPGGFSGCAITTVAHGGAAQVLTRLSIAPNPGEYVFDIERHAVILANGPTHVAKLNPPCFKALNTICI